MARRELVQEYDNLAVVLNFERERLKGACDSTATAYRKAHHHLLSLYAEHELEHALNETCEALVRAMHLSILVQENPLANTTGHQGYVAPDKAVMQQVKSSLEQKIKQMQISLTGEPVLRLTGLSAATHARMTRYFRLFSQFTIILARMPAMTGAAKSCQKAMPSSASVI